MDTVPTKVKARDIAVIFDALRDQRDAATARAEAAEAERDKANELVRALTEETVEWRNQRDEARTERDALRTALTEVLAILKSGRSTGRTAIKALFAAEDVAMAALESAQEA